jgi:hypothetical protein
MKTCQNRTCGKELDPDIHGNRYYCFGPEEDPDKCLKKEKKFLRKEREIKKKRELKLLTTLENLVRGSNSFKSLTLDRFEQLIYPYTDLLERRLYKGSTINYFQNFELTKHELNETLYIHISKTEQK